MRLFRFSNATAPALAEADVVIVVIVAGVDLEVVEVVSGLLRVRPPMVGRRRVRMSGRERRVRALCSILSFI